VSTFNNNQDSALTYSFKHVCIESMALHSPEMEVTSASIEQELKPLYEKLEIPFGTLERMTGVRARRFWADSVMPSTVATRAAELAFAQCGIKPSQIGAIINCSVSRDHFEPATAALVHRSLGFREGCMAFDISNACIGFSNGMMTIASLIESGQIEAGIVVTGETVSRAVHAGLEEVKLMPNIDREKLLAFLPTVTLGSGAVAFILCHERLSKSGHRLKGAAVRSATQHNMLCVGDKDYAMSQSDKDYRPVMFTNAPELMAQAALLGNRAWSGAQQLLGWSGEDLNHIICHQVGKHVNEAFYRTVGLDRAKEFIVYPELGNMVSAAMPGAFTKAIDGRGFKAKDKILLMGYGSGLNAIFTGIEW
jgi:3-oxoacyl-[acyl-carrier-protein] synthase-3